MLKRKMILLTALCLIALSTTIGELAASVAYDTTTEVAKVSVANDTASAKTLHANTRPTKGTGGALLIIRKSNGTKVTSKTFPYYTSISDLTSSVPSGQIRRIYVSPVTAGQQVKGTITYSLQ